MRTNSIRSAATAGLLSVTLAACSSGTGGGNGTVAGGTQGSPGPVAAPSAPPSAAASPSAPAAVPSSALLQASDVRGAEPQPLAAGEFSHVRPLRPCGEARYPSDGTRTAAVAMRYVVPGTEQGSVPTVVVQFAGRHRPGSAAEQFRDIGAALDRCPGSLAEGRRLWVILEADGDSVVVRIDQRMRYADEEPATVSHYAALTLVGNAVVGVADLGWENMGGSEDLVRDLIGKAAQRAVTIG